MENLAMLYLIVFLTFCIFLSAEDALYSSGHS